MKSETRGCVVGWDVVRGGWLTIFFWKRNAAQKYIPVEPPRRPIIRIAPIPLAITRRKYKSDAIKTKWWILQISLKYKQEVKIES